VAKAGRAIAAATGADVTVTPQAGAYAAALTVPGFRVYGMVSASGRYAFVCAASTLAYETDTAGISAFCEAFTRPEHRGEAPAFTLAGPYARAFARLNDLPYADPEPAAKATKPRKPEPAPAAAPEPEPSAAAAADRLAGDAADVAGTVATIAAPPAVEAPAAPAANVTSLPKPRKAAPAPNPAVEAAAVEGEIFAEIDMGFGDIFRLVTHGDRYAVNRSKCVAEHSGALRVVGWCNLARDIASASDALRLMAAELDRVDALARSAGAAGAA
jgi:hypothetical protein